MKAAVTRAAAGDQSFTLSEVPPGGWDDAALRRRWEELVGDADQANAVYASPTWFDHLRRVTPEGELLLFAARDGGGETVGVVPVRLGREEVQYDVASRALFRRRLRVADILGSAPLLPADWRLYARLCEALLDPRRGCDAIYLDTAPVESPFRRFAAEGVAALSLLAYFPYGPRPWHLVRFPVREEEYFAQLKGKIRYELKRRTKKFSEHCGGRLELLRAEDESQVEEFVAGAARVSRNSWQHEVIGTRIADSREQRGRLLSLAERGLLRSYLLRCGERPCAFVFGYQHDRTFHYAEIGYDRDFTHLSPGMVLYQLLVRDLFAHRPPSLLNFGRGDADYKQRFANLQREDVSVIIFRKSLLNYSTVASHFLFRALVRGLRAAVRRVRKRAD
jgi:CelD/BcsL family acetyltransferase involved in cellulose biosynthesis